MDYKTRRIRDGIAKILLSLDDMGANAEIAKAIGKKLISPEFQAEYDGLFSDIDEIECRLVDTAKKFDELVTEQEDTAVRDDSYHVSIITAKLLFGSVEFGKVVYKDVSLSGTEVQREAKRDAQSQTNFELDKPAVVLMRDFSYSSSANHIYPPRWAIIYYSGEHLIDKDRKLRKEYDSILEKHGIVE